jgi:hypothetical protein
LRSRRLQARSDVLRLGPLIIDDSRYGAEVTLGYAHPGYQVAVPLAGVLAAHQGGRAILSAGTWAGLLRVGDYVMLHRRLVREFETRPSRVCRAPWWAATANLVRRLTGTATMSWRDT